jgi:hypothetical protein
MEEHINQEWVVPEHEIKSLVDTLERYGMTATSKSVSEVFRYKLHEIKSISHIPTIELVNELCKRKGVDEYKHGDKTYFEICKRGLDADTNGNHELYGYKNIPVTSKIIVINKLEDEI